MGRAVFLTDGPGGDYLIEGVFGPFMLENDMADPVKIPIPHRTWVKVASSVSRGTILPLDTDAKYVYAIRDAGGDAPEAGDFSEGKEIPFDPGAVIQSAVLRDIYVAAMRSEGSLLVVL